MTRQTLPHGRGSDEIRTYSNPSHASNPSRDRKGALVSRSARLLLLFLLSAPLFAQITGTVTNQTTGKPQSGATVALYKVATRTGQIGRAHV